MIDRFPRSNNASNEEDNNPAIQLYGRRFYKDQTPVEYLAELLLVFASPKGNTIDEGQPKKFTFTLDDDIFKAKYWPEDRIALKLFSFFPISILDTRHQIHEKEYIASLNDIKERINASQPDQEETIRLLQSLFSGFVGVAGNRTWVTYSFLPASISLLSRELAWLHSEATRNPPADWEDAIRLFATDRHIFMARGGEVLFLQLANLFQNGEGAYNKIVQNRFYGHFRNSKLTELQSSIEESLHNLLYCEMQPLNELSNFIESSLSRLKLSDHPKHATLGWTPASTDVIAVLFAKELDNILNSSLSNLEKTEILQILCSLQVLRTLCYLASQYDTASTYVDGFIGKYTWIVTSEDSTSSSPSRKLAEYSFSEIEQILYRVLKAVPKQTGSVNEAKKHGFDIFRKLGKEIGLIIPKTGKGMRFVLPPRILHFLVVAIIEPGQRIPLDRFYERVFAHYGIALGPRQLAIALEHQENSSKTAHHDYAIAVDTRWIEETLRQGGFLVELSDAVSIVRNPAAKSQNAEYSEARK